MGVDNKSAAGRQLAARRREQIEWGLSHGLTTRQIEQKFKVTRRSVSEVRADLGLQTKPKPTKPVYTLDDRIETHTLGLDVRLWQAEIRQLRHASNIPAYAAADIDPVGTVTFHWIDFTPERTAA
jgi:hypothetical protein